MATLTVSEGRANLYRLIDQTAESHQAIHIAGKRASAVLLSTEDWDAVQETLYLLPIPGMRESIREGMAEPLGKSVKSLSGELAQRLLQDIQHRLVYEVFVQENVVRVLRMWSHYE